MSFIITATVNDTQISFSTLLLLYVLTSLSPGCGRVSQCLGWIKVAFPGQQPPPQIFKPSGLFPLHQASTNGDLNQQLVTHATKWSALGHWDPPLSASPPHGAQTSYIQINEDRRPWSSFLTLKQPLTMIRIEPSHIQRQALHFLIYQINQGTSSHIRKIFRSYTEQQWASFLSSEAVPPKDQLNDASTIT